MSISTVRISSLAALAALVSTGMMQAAEQATFHLSVAAHWGQAFLQPGDYRMFLPAPSAGEMKLRVEGAGKTVFELPVATDIQTNTHSNYLQLAEIDGDYFIRELSFGAVGKSFVFSVPKTQRTRNR